MTLTLEHYEENDSFYDNKITAEIVLDSMYPKMEGTRLTTFMLTIPLMVMPELTRHRIYSYCVASNRAISNGAARESATFYPLFRKTAKRGMQPSAFVDSDEQQELTLLWTNAINMTKLIVEQFQDKGVAKELSNRPLHPYQYVKVLVSGTSYKNFLKLRNHKDAQFEMQVVARKMQELLESSTPTNLDTYEWHLPFILGSEQHKPQHEKFAVSVARCARTSYRVPHTDKVSTFEQDVNLFKKLISDPLHASPLEFVATPMTLNKLYGMELPKGLFSEWNGNYKSWIQLRKFFELPEPLPALEPLLDDINKLKTLVLGGNL